MMLGSELLSILPVIRNKLVVTSTHAAIIVTCNISIMDRLKTVTTLLGGHQIIFQECR